MAGLRPAVGPSALDSEVVNADRCGSVGQSSNEASNTSYLSTVPGAEEALDRWILAIMIFEQDDVGIQHPTRFCGTGFLLPSGVFVTCRHCVDQPLQSNEQYGAVRSSPGGYEMVRLHDLAPDANGSDAATARTTITGSPYRLAAAPPDGVGHNVATIGYPGTIGRRTAPNAQLQFDLQSRYIEGYVSRAFKYRPPDGREIRSWELDMPAPGGLSGAPLMAVKAIGRADIIGLIYGRHLVHGDDSASPDDLQLPDYVFGLALYLDVLQSVQGPAWGDATLFGGQG